jgi:hypothetical protein
MSAQSTTEICRPELPSDRRNVMGRGTFQKKEGKIDTHGGTTERRQQERAQARKGDARSSPGDKEEKVVSLMLRASDKSHRGHNREIYLRVAENRIRAEAEQRRNP